MSTDTLLTDFLARQTDFLPLTGWRGDPSVPAVFASLTADDLAFLIERRRAMKGGRSGGATPVPMKQTSEDYRSHVLSKIRSILIDGERALNPDSDPEPDTNDVYDLIRIGIEARKALRVEMQRCAGIASDACLEQDDAGHTRNSDTWMAACAWVRMRITGQEKPFSTPADFIRSEERERCAKLLGDEADSSAELHEHGEFRLRELAQQIRSGQ